MKFNRRFLAVFLVAIIAILFAGSNAQADLIMMHGNSTATVDPDSSAGMHSWTVDGVEHLYQQWFWYRVGDTAEQSIHTLGLIDSTLTNTGANSSLVLEYGNNDLSINVIYSLVGGGAGTGTADLGEQISIANRTDSAMDFHFFQYVDFDLCGSSSGDSAQIIGAGGNTARQTSTSGCIASETVVTPGPSFFEVGQFSSTLTALQDGNPTTLNGNASFGPGDATWAYQWDFTLGAHDSFLISKDKRLDTPEPGLLLLLGAGLAGAGFLRRRR